MTDYFDRFETREEKRWCVYRVGADQPIAVCLTQEAARDCLERIERNEHPWYERLKKLP